MTRRTSMPSGTRTESDSFGPIEVPGRRLLGRPDRALDRNFPFGPREQMPLEIVHALGFIKQAAARVNARIGGLDPQLAEASSRRPAKSRAATSTASSRWSSGRPGRAPSRT